MERSGDDDTNYNPPPQTIKRTGLSITDPAELERTEVYRAIDVQKQPFERSIYAAHAAPSHLVGKGYGDSMDDLVQGFDMPPCAAPLEKPRMAPQKHAGLGLGMPSGLSRSRPMEMSRPDLNLVPKAMQLEPVSFNKDAETPNLPEIYSFNTSVVSTADSESILRGLETTIKEMKNTQCDSNKTKKVVKGVAVVDENRFVNFVINLYATGPNHPRPGHILLEFQKRSGDAYAFQCFFRNVVRELAKRDLVHFGVHTPSGQLPQPIAPLSLGPEFEQLDFTRDPQFLKNVMVNQIGSKYLEPKRQGISILAKATQNRKNINLIAQFGEQGLSTLTNLMTDCHDLPIARGAAASLKNIFAHDNIRVQAHKQQLFKILSAAFLKWSGANERNEVTSSTLVCDELCDALERLAQDSDMIRQYVNQQDVAQLRRVASNSPHEMLSHKAKRLVGMVMAN